ncbi:MAG: PQQ-like beta-propeller repeat protein [Candidatus Riflebacteria bacterium]|nr:PQQ-like beta-propeller repeat protein [Candidatus Riflebacteria bacterium]
MKSSKLNKKLSCFILAGLLIVTLIPAAFAEDVLQWRNNRDGIYNETGLLKSWPDGGPKLLWANEDVGEGYSSPIIVKGKIYLTGIKDAGEFVSSYDLQGKQLWQTVYATGWTQTYPEARTTPTFVEGKLYVISGDGVAAAVDSESGKLLWKSDVWNKYQGVFGKWGGAESPLVVDGKVICTPTGEQTTMVALNASDGALVWKTASLKAEGAYVSPALIEYKGKKQIIGVTSKDIFGVDPQNGNIIWSFDYLGTFFENDANRSRWVINCNTPVCKDDMIFVTSGYDHCGVMLQLNENATGVTMLWKTDVIDTHHGHVVLVDGYLYGSNWLNNNKGNWACIDWKTGKKAYDKEWETKGSIIYADGMLYCYEEKRGNIALVKATPEDFKIISSFMIEKGSKTHWGHPVISNGVLYIRHGTALMAYDISESKN